MKKFRSLSLLTALFAYVASIGFNPTWTLAQASEPTQVGVQYTDAAYPDPAPPQPMPQAVTATPSPLAGHYGLIKIQVSKALQAKGMPRLQALRTAMSMSNEEIDALIPTAEAMATQELGKPVKLGKIGDGSIIKAIEAFFASPQGQALMQALVALIIGLLPKAQLVPEMFWYGGLRSWNA